MNEINFEAAKLKNISKLRLFLNKGHPSDICALFSLKGNFTMR